MVYVADQYSASSVVSAFHRAGYSDQSFSCYIRPMCLTLLPDLVSAFIPTLKTHSYIFIWPPTTVKRRLPAYYVASTKSVFGCFQTDLNWTLRNSLHLLWHTVFVSASQDQHNRLRDKGLCCYTTSYCCLPWWRKPRWFWGTSWSSAR